MEDLFFFFIDAFISAEDWRITLGGIVLVVVIAVVVAHFV